MTRRTESDDGGAAAPHVTQFLSIHREVGEEEEEVRGWQTVV